MKSTKTIQIKQGTATINYAKVAARVAEFLKDYQESSIRTAYDFKDGHVIFKATVYPDVKNLERVYYGTSMGKIGVNKAMEKLETIAVGRALAFAGYLSDGEIASSEEMKEYHEQVIQVDGTDAMKKLEKARGLEDLKKIWRGLKPEERANREVEAYKDSIKEALTPKQNENALPRTENTGVVTTS